MSNIPETNFSIAVEILKKIGEADNRAKQDILNRMQRAWVAEEEPKNTLKAIFTSKAFWDGAKQVFTAPFHFVAGFFKPSNNTPPQILDRADSFDGYARGMCKAIRAHLAENPLILEDIHLNNKERDLLNLPHRSPIKYADEPSFIASSNLQM